MKKIITIALVSVSLAMLITVEFVSNSILGQMNHVEIDKTNEALGMSKEDKTYIHDNTVVPKDKERDDIVNIFLFGVDKNEPDANSRSDSMLILTLDFKNKKVKLSSLMRDMYVDIEGHGKTKLNHAYAYGGAPLAIKTINQNFGTNIRDYVTVDFLNFEKIIDALGGVTINIKQEEIPYINSCTIIKEAKVKSKERNLITKAGEQLLSGNQAVAYTRVRYVGNGDFERTERQRKVLSIIVDKIKEKGITTVLGLSSEILPSVETSMDKQTILNLAVDYFKADEMTLEQERFPVDGYYWDDMTYNIYYLKFDTEITKQQVMDYIYNDIKPMTKQ